MMKQNYTIGSFGRYIPIQGQTVTVQAESLREAIRIVRKRNFSKAWSLRLKNIETLDEQQVCEHCGKQITGKHAVIERHSGPSTHYLHFHYECWQCPKCGTNGPHYCPADIARD